MCGIAGYIGGSPVARERITACLGKMGRRGPDHAASYTHTTADGRHVCLLHSRLSIIDLDERANQPFRQGGQVLVYNGELYNYLEQRQALRKAGIAFTTESDTEVLLATIRRHGWRGLDACEGMWAFACYDEADGTLLLGRDRFGEKPLFLYEADGGLYFASEVKFIAALMGRRLPVNLDHLKRYLVNGYMALYKTPDTFFEGVRELPPASVMALGPDGPARLHRYWKPRYAPDEQMDYVTAVEETRRRLIEAVGLRLRADVPLAFCMSGGIDSNSLISIAKRVFGYDVHGFTIANTDARYEEQAFVEHSVAELGIRHTTIPITPDGFLDNITSLIAYHDAPVYTISFYLHWLLMQAVHAHGYRISVSGTAADELFTGYYAHHNAYLQAVHGTPGFAPALAAWQAHLGPIIRNPYLKNPRLFIDDAGCRDYIFLNADDFAGYLRQPWQEPFTEACYAGDLLRNRMMNEFFHESIPVILHEDDLNAMYFSIENRSPFLDRALFEHAYRIPTRFLIRDAFQKVVLRDAMAGIVPEMILCNRRKVGFNAPVFDFLDVGDPAVRAWLLDDGPIFEHVHRDKIEAITRRTHLPNSESKFLFYFLSAKVFLEQFG